MTLLWEFVPVDMAMASSMFRSTTLKRKVNSWFFFILAVFMELFIHKTQTPLFPLENGSKKVLTIM